MIIQCSPQLKQAELNRLVEKLGDKNIAVHEVHVSSGRYLVAPSQSRIDLREIGTMEGVNDVFYVDDGFKLVSRQWRIHPTRIEFGNDQAVCIGESALSIILGPCSVEDEEQIEHTARFLAKNGVPFMRGGVFKPRSSPYTFRGLGLEGLKMFHRVAHKYGLFIVTEVMQESQIEPMLPYVDIFQVGARNSQNFTLLDALGHINKPVLLKRGLSMTLDEFLQSAEYIFSNGNENIILCERGLRTFEKSYRNLLDLNAVPILKEKTHLPVLVDPSHGIGLREHVLAMSRAGIAAGADGVIVEIHPVPQKARSDARQALGFDEAQKLIDQLRNLHRILSDFD